MSEQGFSAPLEREDAGDVTVVRVKVPLLRSDDTTDAVFDQATTLVAAGRTRLVLNLQAVVLLASAAIGRLVLLLRKLQSAGGRLALCQVSGPIEEVLQMTHLAEVMLVYADEQEAVRSFA